MNDKFHTFSEIKTHFLEDQDFRIRVVDRGSSVVVFTPHGGGIERGTSELVRAIAGDNFSYYLFEGRMKYANESQKMHITSTRFDEPQCCEMIRKHQTSLAIHGCDGKQSVIFVGGRDISLRDKLIETLKEKGYPVERGTEKYAGIWRSNICNRTAFGKGVQLEFSTGIRRLMFLDWRTRNGRKRPTELFHRLVSDIKEVIVEL